MNAEALLLAKFRLGNIVTAPDAKEKLTFEDIASGIRRHQAGDWGDVAYADRAENDLAVQHGRALRSVYQSAKGVTFSLVTAADRSATTVSLADTAPVVFHRRASGPGVFDRPPSVAAGSPIQMTTKSGASEDAKRATGKTVRSLQIEEIGDRWKGFKPRIRMMGKWLERAGFKPGTRVSVICRESGQIELRALAPIPSTVSLASPDEIQNPS